MSFSISSMDFFVPYTGTSLKWLMIQSSKENALLSSLIHIDSSSWSIFGGSFVDFNPGWYKAAGLALVNTMWMQVLFPHLVPLVTCGIRFLKRELLKNHTYSQVSGNNSLFTSKWLAFLTSSHRKKRWHILCEAHDRAFDPLGGAFGPHRGAFHINNISLFFFKVG
jgi:hypothetical protein